MSKVVEKFIKTLNILEKPELFACLVSGLYTMILGKAIDSAQIIENFI